MAIFRIIPEGDVDLVKGENGLSQVVLLKAAPAVRQKLACRLRFFLGEWFLNLREGVPYYRVVLIRRPDLNLIRTLFRRVILSMPEVATVTKLRTTYDPAARTIAVEFDAELVAGGVLQVRQPDSAFVIALEQAA